MKTDIEIAQEAVMQPIKEVAVSYGIGEDDLELYGKYKANLTDDLWEKVKDRPDGKLVLVTAINPTPAGEGKTTITVGLGEALGKMGKNAIIALREPSLKAPGKIIDLIAVFALLAGTATTFSLATPLMSQIAADLLGIDNSKWITILILVITCIVYTFCVVRGMHGIMKLAASCVYLFFGLLAYVLIFGGETRYIIETGFSSIGNLIQNFVSLSTFTDPQRTTSFPQNWTIFYWAYWMVWCVAAPFFIGNISKGRTVKQTILGGYIFGLGGTFTSFIILGNYSLGLQVFGKLDVIGLYTATGNLYTTIIAIVRTLPLAPLVLILLALTMIAFYATSFDAIALVASSYSYKELDNDEEPHMGIKVFWSIMLILLPIALVFSDNSMANLQTVSIIAAFPIAVIIVMIIVSFFKDAKKML